MAKAGARIVVVVAALLIAPSSVCAAVFTWNGNGGSPDPAVPAGGSGTWDAGVAANWWNGTTNVVWPATSSLDDDAVFAGTAGTVTIAGGVAANSLTFSTTGYTLTGGTLTLDGVAPTITTNASVTATIGSSMLGTAGLIKSGSGTLTLSGLSSTAGSNYSGNTIIGAGTLRFDATTSLSGPLIFGASGTSTFVGSLDLTSNATLEALTVRNNSASANTITIGLGNTLQNNGNVTLASGAASGQNTLTVSGGGAWNVVSSGGLFRVGGDNSQATLTMSSLTSFSANLGSSGTFAVGDIGAGSAGSTLTEVATLAVNSTMTANRLGVGFKSTMQGNKTLNLGSGTQTLNVNAIVIGGNDSLSAAESRGNSTFRFAAGTTNASVKIRAADGSGNTDLFVGWNTTRHPTQTQTFNVSNNFADMAFGRMVLGSKQGTTGAGLATVNFVFDTGTMTVANTGTLAMSSGNINGNTVAMTLGGGTVGVGSATFTNGLVLATVSGSQSATATLTINGNDGFDFGVTSGAVVLGNKTGGTGVATATLTMNGGWLTMTGNVRAGAGAATRTLTLNGGLLDMGGFSIGVTGSTIGTLNFRSGTLRNVLEINDGAGLTKTTTGTLTLDGTNSYGGTTTVSDGVLVLASGSAIVATGSLSVADVAGATLRLGVNKTIGSLAGGGSTGGAVDLQSSTLTTGDATDTTFAGIIGGAGGLVKQGGGRFTLTGTNTYAGATAVNAGILTIGGTGSINATSGINVAVGGQLNYNAATALAVSPVLQGNGASSRAVLSGTGGIGVAVTLDDLGDVLAPGNSPGILPFSTSQSWSAYTYDFEVLNWSGTTAGTDFDQIQIADLLTLSTSGTYLLNITGTVAGYTDTDRTWTILTTGSGVGGFDPSKWAISTAGLTGVSGSSSRQFSVQQTGNTIELVYAVPEPATLALAAGGIAVMALALRRRRAA